MRALAAHDILQLWETAQHQHPVDQALALLTAAEPGCSRDELAALPLGVRNQRLLALRRLSYGDRLGGRGVCPQCNETVEFDLSCSSLLALPDDTRARAFEINNYTLRIRPLDSFDLAAAAAAADVTEARRLLMQRCVVEARRDDAVIDTAALPPTLRDAIAEAALAADPGAELLLDLRCPACAHRWQSLLDIVHILWGEVAARAQRLLLEVHLLARAYGWCEADILALSPARRAAYLQRVAS